MKYQVKPGDTIISISTNVLGSPYLTPLIIDLNPESGLELIPGQILVLPDKVERVETNNNDLLGWILTIGAVGGILYGWLTAERKSKTMKP